MTWFLRWRAKTKTLCPASLVFVRPARKNQEYAIGRQV
jgi:hypothetical protein